MTTRVCDTTLGHFRSAAASPHPMPAGVAIAAVSSGLALGLLAKVLAIGSRRKAPSGNLATLGPLAAAAQAASERMLQLADDDVAAFEAYLAATRSPSTTEEERQNHRQVVGSAVRRAIEVPLAAAQEAAAGLQLCSDAAALTPLPLTADLGVTAGLLASALRGFLLCAQSNVRQLAPEAAAFREHVAAETQRLEGAFRLAEVVLDRARTALE